MDLLGKGKQKEIVCELGVGEDDIMRDCLGDRWIRRVLESGEHFGVR